MDRSYTLFIYKYSVSLWDASQWVTPLTHNSQLVLNFRKFPHKSFKRYKIPLENFQMKHELILIGFICNVLG